MADKRLLIASEVTYNRASKKIISTCENIEGNDLDSPWLFAM
jgi:hypothetical protein